MSEVNEPNYKHYSRLNTTLADKAQWLLASFELSGKNISDPDEYNKLLEKEMKSAYEVLRSAFNSGMLKFTCDEDPFEYDSAGGTHYHLEIMTINISEFCSWAAEKYKLPDELAELATPSASNDIIKNKKPETENDHEAPQPPADEEKNPVGKVGYDQQKPESKSNLHRPPNVVNGVTKPKGSLLQAMEHIYLKIKEEGNTDTLKPRNIDVFLKRFRKFITGVENRKENEYVLERIEDVNPSDPVKTVITKERIISRTNERNHVEDKRTYNMYAVSKRLTYLRSKYPLS